MDSTAVDMGSAGAAMIIAFPGDPRGSICPNVCCSDLVMTRQGSYTQMEEAQKRLVELLSYQRNRPAYRKRTENELWARQILEALIPARLCLRGTKFD